MLDSHNKRQRSTSFVISSPDARDSHRLSHCVNFVCRVATLGCSQRWYNVPLSGLAIILSLDFNALRSTLHLSLPRAYNVASGITVLYTNIISDPTRVVHVNSQATNVWSMQLAFCPEKRHTFILDSLFLDKTFKCTVTDPCKETGLLDEIAPNWLILVYVRRLASGLALQVFS